MSSTSAPIAPHQFAAAIKDLPLANLHFKAAEIRNSIEHLESSNLQLQSYADDGDSDCREAIQENVSVIQRMKERIQLLKREVEDRGFKWGKDDEEEHDVEMNGNGSAADHLETSSSSTTHARPVPRHTGGSLSDAELAQRLSEQMDEDSNMDGVHL